MVRHRPTNSEVGGSNPDEKKDRIVALMVTTIIRTIVRAERIMPRNLSVIRNISELVYSSFNSFWAPGGTLRHNGMGTIVWCEWAKACT